jgi:hypothetical protein
MSLPGSLSPTFLPARPAPAADLAALRVWLIFRQEDVPDRFRVTTRDRQPTRSGGVAGGSSCHWEPMASSNLRRPEFLDRLADLVPPPWKHRHRYHGVLAPNHKLRRAVTPLAIGNIGKRCNAAAGGHGGVGHGTEGCCDANQKPRSHDTSRIAWAKLLAREPGEAPRRHE